VFIAKLASAMARSRDFVGRVGGRRKWGNASLHERPGGLRMFSRAQAIWAGLAVTAVDVIAWFAVRAGAKLDASRNIPGDRPRRSSHGRNVATHLGVAAPAAGLGAVATPDRAGQLVPMREDALEQEVSRSLVSVGALWAAVGLILLLLVFGYFRRRWRRREGGEALPIAARNQPRD